MIDKQLYMIFVIIIIESFTIGCDYRFDECEKKLVIDNDGGADDAEAVIISLLNEKYFDGPCVVALTITYGNVNISQAIINNKRVLELTNRTDIPIYAGADGPLISGRKPDHYFGYDGLGDNNYTSDLQLEIENEPAALALIELSKKYEGDLTIVAIGPATNIALAMRLDPGFVERLSHLYLGGGNVPSLTNPKPEFNVAVDPEAYYIVADTAKTDKTTLIPFSQVMGMIIEKDWRKNVLGRIPTPTVQALNGYERISLAVNESWSLLDPAVAGVVFNTDVTEEYRTAEWSVCLHGERRGITEFDFSSPEPNSRVFYKGNAEVYKQFLTTIYSAELEKSENESIMRKY